MVILKAILYKINQIKCISGLGKEDVTRLLIKSGCNVNERNHNSYAPIHIAAQRGEIYITMYSL